MLSELAAAHELEIAEVRRRFGPAAAAVAAEKAVVVVPMHGALRRVLQYAAEAYPCSAAAAALPASIAALLAAAAPALARLLQGADGRAELAAASPIEAAGAVAAGLCVLLGWRGLFVRAAQAGVEWRRRAAQREAWGQLLGLARNVPGANRFPRLAGPTDGAVEAWTAVSQSCRRRCGGCRGCFVVAAWA